MPQPSAPAGPPLEQPAATEAAAAVSRTRTSARMAATYRV
jgi:hypothetical protein